MNIERTPRVHAEATPLRKLFVEASNALTVRLHHSFDRGWCTDIWHSWCHELFYTDLFAGAWLVESVDSSISCIDHSIWYLCNGKVNLIQMRRRSEFLSVPDTSHKFPALILWGCLRQSCSSSMPGVACHWGSFNIAWKSQGGWRSDKQININICNSRSRRVVVKLVRQAIRWSCNFYQALADEQNILGSFAAQC